MYKAAHALQWTGLFSSMLLDEGGEGEGLCPAAGALAIWQVGSVFGR